MAFMIEENGNIILVQGDSGHYPISGLPTDKNYTAYFAIQNMNRIPVGTEIAVQTNMSESIVFVIDSSLTDCLEVKKGNETEEYQFGIKLCSDDGMEDTLLLNNGKIGDINTITVYPKKAEGTINE